jgi:mRNA interferase MazF
MHASDAKDLSAGLRINNRMTVNSKTGLALCCPITSRIKGYPFECPLPPGLPIEGVALADQVRSLDWRTRRATAICKLPADFLDEVVARILPLLGHED